MNNENFNLPFSSLLSESELELIISKSNKVRYNNKDIIFKQLTRTSHIMFVNDGLVKIYKEGRNNRNYLLKITKPGNFIGSLSIFGDEVFQYSASAVDSTEICFIDINTFKNILLENNKYCLKLIQIISKEGLYIFDKLLHQTYKQLPGRIADVILYFSEIIYQSHTFSFPLTRKELAEFAGTTKESFIRTLTEFKNDKIIELEGSQVKIISIDIIKTLSTLG